MQRSARWALGIIAGAVVLPVTFWVVREVRRDNALLAFCKEARAGMPFADFLRLEKRLGIDESYLVQANFAGYIDQAHSTDLEFRSHFMDPDFACAVVHDGSTVKIVQLLTIEGFDPG
jgi:hypothetical protein